MAVINFARREIEAKIVFYGPALSGKTTNIKMAHASVPPAQRGQLSTLATEDERTLYFDYAPITLGKIVNFDAHFKLFSVPGQAYYSETRKAVLQGADGVVFVADSAPDRAKANIESLIDLERNLKALGHKLSQFPLVLQFNKRDVPGARSLDDMARDLNWFGAPVVEAKALTGEGISATLQAISKATADRIRQGLAGQESSIGVEAVDRADRKSDAEVIVDQLAAIRNVRPAEELKAKEDLEKGKLRADDVDSFLFHNVVREGIGPELLIEDDEDTDSLTGGNLPRFPDLRLGLLPPALSGWRVKEVRTAQVTAEGGVRLELVIRERQGRRRAMCAVLLEARVEQDPLARAGAETSIRPVPANIPANPPVSGPSFSELPKAPPPPPWSHSGAGASHPSGPMHPPTTQAPPLMSGSVNTGPPGPPSPPGPRPLPTIQPNTPVVPSGPSHPKPGNPSIPVIPLSVPPRMPELDEPEAPTRPKGFLMVFFFGVFLLAALLGLGALLVFG